MKLRKQVVETASTQNGNQQITTTSTYISGFIYEQVIKASTNEPEALQFFAHEKGRVRPTTDVNHPFRVRLFRQRPSGQSAHDPHRRPLLLKKDMWC